MYAVFTYVGYACMYVGMLVYAFIYTSQKPVVSHE